MKKSNSDDLVFPVLPLRDVIVFPNMVIPLFVGREKSIKSLEVAMDSNKQIMLVAQKTADLDDPKDSDIYRFGTLATVLQLLKLPDGTIKVLVEGASRAEIQGQIYGKDYFEAKVNLIDENIIDDREVEILSRTVIDSFDHPIDRFLEKERQEDAITAAPQADKLTLLRRAYLDLTGLPPTLDESEAFLADTAPGSWERVIDQLLASSHYGERWGRHWLDVARYADSDGYEQDVDRENAWRYRDYIVNAFNSDKPYDEFITEQIAGDELDETTHESRIATGFLRAGPRVNFREKDNPERRWDYLDDVIATLGRGVLGMTIQCARCHDHKFDPILQKDYYSMAASIYGYIETDWPMLPDDQAQEYLTQTAEYDDRVSVIREQIREIEQPYLTELKIERIRNEFPEDILEAVLTPEDERSDGQRLLSAQVLTLGVPRGQVNASMSEEDKARREILRQRIEEVETQRPDEPPMIEVVTDGDFRYTPDRAGDNVLGCPECRI